MRRSTRGTLSVDGVDLGATNATFALAGNRLHVQASAPALAIVARADVDTLEPYHYQAETRLEGARIAALVPPRVRERVAVSEGIVTGTLRARGTLRQPLPAAADVSLDRSTRSSTALASSWRRRRRSSGRRAGRRGEPRSCASEEARARLAGSLGAEPGRDQLRLTADSPLSELVALAGPLLPADARLVADGTLATDLSSAERSARPSRTARSPCVPPASPTATSRRPPTSSSMRVSIRRKSSFDPFAPPGSSRCCRRRARCRGG